MSRNKEKLEEKSLRELEDIEIENWHVESIDDKGRPRVWVNDSSSRFNIKKEGDKWILTGENSTVRNYDENNRIDTYKEAKRKAIIWLINHETGSSSMM